MPCDVWSSVFKDINLSQKIKFHTGVNDFYNEIWFFICTADSDEIDKVVIYNTEERWWSIGDFTYTAWNGDDELFTQPYAANTDNCLWEHEVGVNKGSTALEAYLESYDVDLVDGTDFIHIRRLIPDFKILSGSIEIKLKTRNYPHDTPTEKGPETVMSSTRYVNLRGKGRQIAMRIDSSNVGDNWEMGNWKIEAYVHGRR